MLVGFRVLTVIVALAVGTALLAPLAIAGSLSSGSTATGGDMEISQKPRKPERPIRPRPANFTTAIEQAAGQADPALVEPVVFDVTFGEAIDPSTFLITDIIQNGTAGITDWLVINSGDDRHFTLRASGLTAGTIIPTLAANAVQNASDEGNLASGGTDHSVTFSLPPCASATYLYAAGWSPPEIDVYCIGVGGALLHVETVAAPADVRDMQPSADGNNLFYAHSGLTRYTVSSDGTLFEDGTAPVGSGAFNDLTLDPSDADGRYLYGTHSKNFGGLYVYDTTTGASAPLLVQSITSGLYLPRGAAIRPSGSHLHIANYSPQEVFTYPLNPNGTINAGGMVRTTFTARPDYFAIPPGPPVLFWTEVPGGSVITGQVSGASVSLADSIFSGFGARQLTIDSAGTRLYVANNNTDDISVFEVGAGGGLSAAQLQPTARRPEHLILDPTGSYLYVASAGDVGDPSTISVYRVEADGTLTDLVSPVFTPQGIFRLAVIDRSP